MTIVVIPAATTAGATAARFTTSRTTTASRLAATAPWTAATAPWTSSSKSASASAWTAASESAGPATSEATTAAARRLGTRFVDIQGATTEFFSVQGCDSLVSFSGIRHLHKCESPGAAGVPIRHHTHLVNFSVWFKEGAQFGFGCAVRDVAYEKLLHGVSSFL
jgi:hypothetical protein